MEAQILPGTIRKVLVRRFMEVLLQSIHHDLLEMLEVLEVVVLEAVLVMVQQAPCKMAAVLQFQ